MRGEFKSVTAAAIVGDDGLWPVEFTAKAPASLFALAGRTEQKTISSFYGATAIMLSD
jgi:hypothetical protein